MAEQQQYQPPMPPPPYYVQKKKSRWWIPVVIIVGVLVIFFGVILAIIGVIGSSFEKEPYKVKENSVLYLDLSGGVSEFVKIAPLANIFGAPTQTSFNDILKAINTAKDDKKIKGIYIKGAMAMMGFAKAKELQEVLTDFKESKKFIYAFIETGNENVYYYTLPADSIFMPSEGLIEMNGYGISAMFIKGFLDKIGIDMWVLGFEDFKSAGETIGRKSFSDSARYQLQVILAQRYKMLTEAIAKYRKIEPHTIHSALARGIYTADSLKELGFIDAFRTEADVKEMMKAKIFGKKKDDKESKLRLVSIKNYVSSDLPEKGKIASEDKQIAIIYGVGPIQNESDDSPFSNENVIAHSEFVENLKKAREDKDVKAIILRIDSPGGSVIASDAIQEEILKTKAIKPVYASMSDVAASGGYYISMPCDTIIAHPATITGSIGVILAIPNIKGLMGHLDLTGDTISTGPAAQFMNGMYPYSDKDKKVVHDIAQKIYFRFINKVAKYRNMTFDQVRAIAKGRVWTGEDAKRIGIVDVLGGWQDALKIAKRRIGIPDTQKVYVKIYPKPMDEFEAILKMFGLSREDEEVSSDNNIADVLGIKPEVLKSLIEEMPESVRQQIKYTMSLMGISRKENVLAALPYYIDIK